MRSIPVVVAFLVVAVPLASCKSLSNSLSAEDHVAALGRLVELRQLRNSPAVLNDVGRLIAVTQEMETLMQTAYLDGEGKPYQDCDIYRERAATLTAAESCRRQFENKTGNTSRRPGNFHGVKSFGVYVGAIADAHPQLSFDSAQSIVASEWYHPGLTATPVWCVENCGERFRLAKLLDANFDLVSKEVVAFFSHPDAALELKGVGKHTTQFDGRIAGNGTWVDVRLWRGRAYNKRLCERHFRAVCSIVEASPEIWTNPWSHVLLSVLVRGSWVPFHQGHTNGQLTYHLPVTVPSKACVAELAVVDRGGSAPEEDGVAGDPKQLLAHPEERIVRWKKGKTLVFDDSFTHAVRVRSLTSNEETEEMRKNGELPLHEEARIVLLMRGWHPELRPEEREALRDFVRRGGEEEPTGYEFMPVTPTVFRL
eukprot:TRINITY_DN60998_c0_g1_i1.p1 TRINITY_DN60998_c0_g1~~TRINITY_DN60998_c0_g1_i1.p1  ORF type:complete len:425 (-),score=55.50 TRINITY_DN60998_c0_g1_i1:114-1388(-)